MLAAVVAFWFGYPAIGQVASGGKVTHAVQNDRRLKFSVIRELVKKSSHSRFIHKL